MLNTDIKTNEELERMTVLELSIYKSFLWNNYPQKSKLNAMIKYMCIEHGDISPDTIRFYEIYEYKNDHLHLKFLTVKKDDISLKGDGFIIFYKKKLVYDKKECFVLDTGWIKQLNDLYANNENLRKRELIDLLSV